MAQESRWTAERIAASVRFGAMVAVVGLIALAAEEYLAREVLPEGIVATETAPNFAAASPAPAAAQAAAADRADYFPAQFPAPKGEPAEPMPTF